MDQDLLFAFLITLFAGLATGVGGLIVFFSKTTNKKFLAACLSFSVGVMLYIAFAELFFESLESLEYSYGEEIGYLITTLSFFAGIALMWLINWFLFRKKAVPETDNFENQLLMNTQDLKETGVMSATALAIHNFPEGIITFMAAMYSPMVGISIAIAIIIHNIPESIAMATPIYYSTGSRAKALLVSFGVGLTEPLGALLAWVLLQNIFDDMEPIFGISFAIAAGIMVFVALNQLLPSARRYAKHKFIMQWLFVGMAIMALSLVIIEFVF